ncbi:MAG: glycosyltransferase family 2 protein [Actinomycetota bacterium]|nr:glycosyltransferase family 2 protein [Actinomycetota bacterium]
MIRVTAILVSHDGEPWLPQTVATLASQTLPIDRIVAVDTDSQDSSVNLLRSAGIHVIESERELGFGSAIARAVEATPAFTPPKNVKNFQEWLWILHDDLAPAKDCLEKLLAAIEEKPQVVLAGPKLRGWHDRKHLLELGVSIATNGVRWTGLEYREQDQGQHDDERDVLAVSTAGMLVRRDVFEEMGGFDPNLSLFRDDVDFGWRIRAAGYSVLAVPEAVAFHGEASANERRSIDVSDAYLHRPLLLDRRHAAYVLLANASFYYLPLLAFQLFTSALVRAGGYLLAKRPGYAADEIAAVALVLIKPQEILIARKARKANRLIASSNIKKYLPPRGVQIRLAYERARTAVERYFSSRVKFQLIPSQNVISSLDLNDESLENEDLLSNNSPSRLRALLSRPLFLISLAVLLLTLIASRNRFGAIMGGALIDAPDSNLDLFSKYFESWHSVGLGSSANTPTWVLILALLSSLVLGNVSLFISIFFLLAPPLIFWIGYKFAKSYTSSNLIAIFAAALYSFSPPVLYATSHGLIGTLVIAIAAPLIVSSLFKAHAVENYSQRALFGTILLYALVLAFSGVTFIIIAIWHLTISLWQSFNELISENRDLKLIRSRVFNRSLLLLGAIALNIPWSLELLAHPSRALLEPGLSLTGGQGVNLLFGNPSSIIWLLSAAPVIAFIALFRVESRVSARISFFVLTLASLLMLLRASGHGSSQPVEPAMGGVSALYIALAIVAGLQLLEKIIPEIKSASLNFRHFATATIALSTLATILISTIWWVGPGAAGPLLRGSTFSVPEFITANATTSERYKSLLIRKKEGKLLYAIVRDRTLELGDSDLTYGSSKLVDQAVAGLVSGAGIDASSILGGYGIRYLFLAQPINKSLARTIDGIGGFTRASSTDTGIVWKVVGASSRAILIPYDAINSSTAEEITLPSGEVEVSGSFTRSGIVRLAERFDGRWRILVNSRSVPLTQSIDGLPQFEVTEPGDFIIFHDGTARRGWISLQLIFFLTALILSLPARRKKSEVPIEELA